MKNLIETKKVHLKFPLEEFKDYFNNNPSGIIRELIITNAIGCYCFNLIKSGFSTTNLIIIYSLEQFEITHLKLLSNFNKFHVLNTKMKNKKINSFLMKGSFYFKINPNFKTLQLQIEINLNIKKLTLPKSNKNNMLFHALYNTLADSLSKERTQQNYPIKLLTINSVIANEIYFPILNFKMDIDTIDTLACVFHLCLKNKTSEYLFLSINDILELKGTKKLNYNQSGYKKNLKLKTRQELLSLADTIQIEDYTWGEDTDKERETNLLWSGDINLFKIKEWTIKNDYFFIKPSDFLEELIKKRAYTKINTKVLSYTSNNNKIEKQLAYQIAKKLQRTNQKDITIKNIIEGIKLNHQKPSLTRDRTEQALDKLVDDKIIKSWHYTKINEELFRKNNWLNKWLNLKITLRKR